MRKVSNLVEQPSDADWVSCPLIKVFQGPFPVSPMYTVKLLHPPSDFGVFFMYNLWSLEKQPKLKTILAFSFTACSGVSQAFSSVSLHSSLRVISPWYPSLLALSCTRMSCGQPYPSKYILEIGCFITENKIHHFDKLQKIVHPLRLRTHPLLQQNTKDATTSHPSWMTYILPQAAQSGSSLSCQYIDTLVTKQDTK